MTLNPFHFNNPPFHWDDPYLRGDPLLTTMVVIGDSWVSAEIASDGQSSATRGIGFNTNMHLKNYFQITNIKGGSSERLDEIAARFQADVLDNNPGYCMIIGGLNDLIANRTATQMFASTKSMIDAAMGRGIIPIVLPCNFAAACWSNGVLADQAAVEQRVVEWSDYNNKLLNYSYESSGWIYAASAYNNIIDHEHYDTTYTTPKAAGVNAPAILDACAIAINGSVTDASHPGSAGAFRIGKAVATQLAAILPAADNLPHHYNDIGAGCWNCLQKQSNTPSSTGLASDADITNLPAEGWMARLRNNDAAAQATITATARTDIAGGFWTTYACVDMDKATIIEQRESDPGEFGYTSNKHLFSDYGISPGDTIILTFEMKIHTVSGEDRIDNFSGWMNILDSGNGAVDTLTVNKNGGSTSESYVGADFEDTPLVISSLPYVVPATSDYWYVYFEAQISNGSHVVSTTDFTFEAGRVGLRKIA